MPAGRSKEYTTTPAGDAYQIGIEVRRVEHWLRQVIVRSAVTSGDRSGRNGLCSGCQRPANDGLELWVDRWRHCGSADGSDGSLWVRDLRDQLWGALIEQGKI